MCGSGERYIVLPGEAIAALFSDKGLSGYISFEGQGDGRARVRTVTPLPSKAHELRIHKYGQYLNENANDVLYRQLLVNERSHLTCYIPLIVSAEEKGIIG